MQSDQTESSKVLKVLSGIILERLSSDKPLIDHCVLANTHSTLDNTISQPRAISGLP